MLYISRLEYAMIVLFCAEGSMKCRQKYVKVQKNYAGRKNTFK